MRKVTQNTVNMRGINRYLGTGVGILSTTLIPLSVLAADGIHNKPQLGSNKSYYLSRVTSLQPTNQAFLLSQNLQQPEFNFKDFDFWSNQCSVLENARKYNQALTACEKAISLKPKRKNTDLWLSRSNILLQLGNTAESVASYDQILKREPKNSYALTQRCEALTLLGSYEDAMTSCEKALQVNGNWRNSSPANAWHNRSIALQKMSRLPEALTSLERATTLNPNFSLAFSSTCGVLTSLQRYDEAVQACDLAIKTDGDWGKASAAVAWSNKAEALIFLGKKKDAVAAYEYALKINPKDSVSWTTQGFVLQTIGQHEKALASFNRAIDLNPKYSKALMLRCATLNQLRQFSEALTSCEQAVQGDGNWDGTGVAESWHHRSTALLGLQQYESALASCERALTLKEDYAEAWSNKGISLWYLGKREDARIAAKRATDINPKYVYGWFNYGRILSSLKKHSQAVDAYNQALKGDIASIDDSTLASIWANNGAALWQLKKYNLALKSTNEAIKINPKSFEGWYNKGIILLDLGKYSQALTSYRQANKLNPGNSYVLTGISMVLANQGKYTEALKVIEEALNINPNYAIAQKHKQKILSKL